jgi:hypothetical protein
MTEGRGQKADKKQKRTEEGCSAVPSSVFRLPSSVFRLPQQKKTEAPTAFAKGASVFLGGGRCKAE